MGRRMEFLVSVFSRSSERLLRFAELVALYKEVQEYYENGLEIPQDVTLLFADDNFGTIRRLPTGEERKRKGGAGVSPFPSFLSRMLNSF